MIKSFYSIQELLELEIPGFPKYIYGLRKKKLKGKTGRAKNETN